MRIKSLLASLLLSASLGVGSTFAQQGKALVLNGTDEYMRIPHHADFSVSPSESFTVTFQVNVKKYSHFARFLAKRLQSGSGNKSGFELWGATNNGQFYAGNTPNKGGANVFSVWSGKNGAENQWIHIGFVMDRAKGIMYMYQGGVEATNSKAKGKNPTSWECTNPYDIIVGASMQGAEDKMGFFLNGQIDNLRFWKRALTAEEIMQDKTSAKPNTKNLIAAYDFENISNNRIRDISNNHHDGILYPLPVDVAIKQTTGFTGRGNEAQSILTLELGNTKVTPNRSTIKSLEMELTGSAKPQDISKIKVFLRNGSEKEILLGEATPKSGRMTIPLNAFASKTLAGDKSVFRIAYDISKTAEEGKTVDAKLHSLNFENGESKALEMLGNPKGERMILLAHKRLFAPGQYGSNNYRIPALITAKDGSLIAMCDRRKNNEADLPQDIDVVAKRSTDGGLTWSEPVTVVAGKGYGEGYGDAGLVMAKDGTIVAVFAAGMGLHGRPGNIGRTYIAKSKDNGATWGKVIDITDQLYGPKVADKDRKEWVGVFCASGRGLCTRDGRIMFVAGAKKASGPINNYLFYSDDKGDTWHVSSCAKVGGDEAKVVELNDGRLLMSIRHGGAGSGTKPRPYVISRDKGNSWSEVKTWEDIKDPACNGDMINYTSRKDGYERNRLLHSIPYSNRGWRENVSVLVSYNEGETWKYGRSVSPGSSAYSSLTILKNGTIGVFFEEHERNAGDGYSLFYANVSLDWLTNGADQYHAPNSGIETLKQPIFSHKADKNYTEAFDLSMENPNNGGNIHYTLDGSTPTEDSPVYMNPIKITKNTLVKAIVYKAGEIESDVMEAYYKIVNPNEYEIWDEFLYPRAGQDNVVQMLLVRYRNAHNKKRATRVDVAGEKAERQTKIVYNRLGTIIAVEQGKEVTVEPRVFNMKNVHYYVYVDWNRNKKFEESELVSYSHYRATENDKWMDSNGVEVDPMKLPKRMPSFTIPADVDPGKTGVRFKVDYNSKAPNGNLEENSMLSAHRGTICDFTLDIKGEKKKTALAELDTNNPLVYAQNGVLYVKGSKLASVEVFNALGEKLASKVLASGKEGVSLSLTSGTYLVVVKNVNGEKQVKKVIL